MKKSKDKFSKQSDTYKKFRPTYPEELFNDILDLVDSRQSCWDCGTGNGQVAVLLSEYFDAVYATDLSSQQIQNAEKKKNIHYQVGRAEVTDFNDSQFDLITVAQAFHWFDFKAFNKEANRVLKNGGVISIWGYGLLRISEEIDVLIDHFYKDIIGPYWDAEREHIDNKYEGLPFDFEPIKTENNRVITVRWNLEHLRGYFNSWSSVRNYMEQHQGKNPVDDFINDLKRFWKEGAEKEVSFPIFLKMGKVSK